MSLSDAHPFPMCLALSGLGRDAVSSLIGREECWAWMKLAAWVDAASSLVPPFEPGQFVNGRPR